MTLKASQIPLEVDVWNEIEADLSTGLKNIAELSFHYSVKRSHVHIGIDFYEEEQLKSHYINLNNEEAENLVIRLCERFNIEWENIVILSFRLKPGEIPIFNVEVYPFVSCVSTLDVAKSRMNPITID